MKTIGYAAHSADAPLSPYTFERRALRPNDVALEILYTGVCHSDLHMTRNDFGMSSYPMVAGHEIIGRVIEVGPEVTRFNIGDPVAVGTLVDSCQHCDSCRSGHEMHCRNGMTQTYGSPDRIDGTTTQGGYSKHMIVREEFALNVPEGLDLSKAAPLLCAGVTTYLPLREWKVGPGSRVAVVGMGGLGHMAIKLAVGLGAEVAVISRSLEKQADARALGAEGFLVSSDFEAMGSNANAFDVIIDTIPVDHDVNPYLPLLDNFGALVVVGYFGALSQLMTFPLLFGGRKISGSLVGGIAQTQELLDFCGRANILPEVEMIRMDQINEAFERMEKSDVRYRFVVDMSTLPATETA
jgi:uncharacterized zinc-type alcohol dehydrogenase-like protein